MKFKKRMENPVENQRIFENTQPAIIEKGQWEQVQELRKNKCRPTKTGPTSIFSGLVYCADCGAKHSPVRENGRKQVRIDLHFTYVGQIRIPLKIGRESLNESEPA